MSIVPKDSVRFQVALAVLVTITLSWLLSTGLANYLNYLSIRSVRREMLKYPVLYPQPLPEPRFSILDFVLGRPPGAIDRIDGVPRMSQPPPPRAGIPAEPPPPRGRVPAPPAPDAGRRVPPEAAEPAFLSLELKWVLLRLVIALGLATLAGVWIGRKLTKPLAELAEGAHAFHSRDFDYRVPATGKSEFTAVAAAMNEMADEVSRHIRSLEDDAQRRRQFLADVAHELRSPVTTMRTMAGALQDGVAGDPERKSHAISVLVRTSERMLRLVQDVMELVELDLDKLPISRSEVDVRALVAAALASHEAEAAKAGIAILPLKQGGPIRASIDADRITQVLDNVVGNAIIYAGSGSTVSVDVGGSDPLRIIVTDTGVGIPAKDLPHILDSFYRVNAARTPGENHIGLGLSIARRMVEAHGGKLSIISEEGKGTAVTILIPRD